MTLAVFDVDGTLVTGASTERRFFRWLARRGRIGPIQLAAFLWFSLRRLPRFGRHTMKKNKAYLKGLPESVVADEAREFVAAAIVPSFNPECLQKLREHRSSGDRLVILTGTLGVIAAEIAAKLDVAEFIACRCERKDGRYTASPPLLHPFGSNKRQLVAELASKSGVSLADVHAYGDSIYDRALLESVGHPVCVTPDNALRRHAESRGWEILDNALADAVGF